MKLGTKKIQLEDLIPLYDDFIEDFFIRNYIYKMVEVDVNNNKNEKLHNALI
ncbi:MAG: hypothetical protein FWG98_09755 [Candidatus Cloacimonetes bacterium]|nr:hypothetical protein [Candidatus Cloacimonadota bacterium]